MAQKSDISFGGGGGMGSWAGFGGLAGGGYSDTDIGKVISAAYFNAFTDLVHYMQNQAPGQQAASRPRRCAARHRPDLGARRALAERAGGLQPASRPAGLPHRPAQRRLDGSRRRERQPRLGALHGDEFKVGGKRFTI